MSVLDEIIAGVRADLEERKRDRSLSELKVLAAEAPAALEVLSRFQPGNFGVIAEVKRKSPSKGELADIADPAALARAYELGGAAAISVLTERRRFGGTLADLDAVRAAVTTPLLRKDFIVDEYQVWEARAHGADLVLLIVAGLEEGQLQNLHGLAISLGMTPLVEVHDAEEVERALALDVRLLGVNNRDLKTLEVHPDQFMRLAPMVPDSVPKIAESGISSEAEVEAFAAAGAAGVLVGEALVKSGRPTQSVAAFTAAGQRRRN